MDVRYLKSGHIRVRFKLNDNAFLKVREALALSEGGFPNSKLNVICMAYLGGGPSASKLPYHAVGNNRLLFKLHQEQYENLLAAVRVASEPGRESEEVALARICQYFLAQPANGTE